MISASDPHYQLRKCLKEIRKITQVNSKILGLMSTQQTKGYLVEAVARRCSVKKCGEIFGKIHRKMSVQEIFKKIL